MLVFSLEACIQRFLWIIQIFCWHWYYHEVMDCRWWNPYIFCNRTLRNWNVDKLYAGEACSILPCEHDVPFMIPIPFHTQSWYYNLLSINLFMCGMIQTGVLRIQQLSQSFDAPVSQLHLLRLPCLYTKIPMNTRIQTSWLTHMHTQTPTPMNSYKQHGQFSPTFRIPWLLITCRCSQSTQTQLPAMSTCLPPPLKALRHK